MRNLVIYDTIGGIIFQASGNVQEPKGVPFMWVEVPQNKRLISIDTSNEVHVPVFEDILPTEFEVLSEKVDTTTETIDLILTETIPSILSSL